jgi:large subunit ribosomal protein L22
MEVQALTRYARMSPKKMREVSRIIQGRKAAEAADYLALIPRKSARLIAKTLRSAIANAENNNNLSADSLTVKLALIEAGPALKRFKAGARGTAKPRRKRMSHIRIVLSDGNAS